jgi:hypothetical protein
MYKYFLPGLDRVGPKTCHEQKARIAMNAMRINKMAFLIYRFSFKIDA